MLPAIFLTDFPSLAHDNHSVTSPQTDEYNCIAWAAGEDDRWWWPGSPDETYWPQQVPRIATIQAFSDAFATLGYSECNDGSLEPGLEKVVLYVDSKGVPTHMARQLATGGWTSKLGQEFDISHATPEVVAAGVYGRVALFMKR